MANSPQPRVSVVVPNYNHAPFLRQRLDSIVGQTFQDFELILLDDCSTDESRSIISECAKDPRVRIEFNDVNSGSSFKQWKKGIELARGEYIWVAESDDYADERLLEKLVRVLDEEPEVTFAYCRSFRVTRDGRPNGFADWYLADLDAQRWTADFRADGLEACRQTFVHANSVPNASSAVFRRSVYERVGGVDESLVACGDWKLWVLMALEGKIAYLSEPLNSYREHDVTVRTAMDRTGRGAGEHLRMVRWMLGRVTPTEAVVEKAYAFAAAMWVYPVLNRRVPFPVRWGLLRDAIANDPHALRRMVQGILTVVGLKAKKEFRLLRQRFEGRPS
jgi:glycosyltransferase involved in cell wall biosynthesis